MQREDVMALSVGDDAAMMQLQEKSITYRMAVCP